MKKCIREEVHKDVLVVGNYDLSDVPGQITDITVSSRYPATCIYDLIVKKRTSSLSCLLIVAHHCILFLF